MRKEITTQCNQIPHMFGLDREIEHNCTVGFPFPIRFSIPCKDSSSQKKKNGGRRIFTDDE